MNIVTTAVLPVAGMGSRFLPVTKASPKEMLPIIDKPLIQYIVDEAVASGIKQLVLVTSYTKRAIEDYFDSNFELETRLRERGKLELLQSIKALLPSDVSVVYVRQPEPKGLGDAVLCAEHIVGRQPFAVLLADDIIDANEPCLKGMIDRYQQTQGSVLAVEQVGRDRIHQYGVVQLAENGLDLSGIVEKPTAEQAPSNLGVIGRYILTPDVFDHLKNTPLGSGGELQLTDAIERLLAHERVTAFRFSGRRFDCGSKEGFLRATLAYAQKIPKLRAVLDEITAVESV
jgi:UTP--glucose-1-phosphate uridylyltransferase